VMHEAAIGDGGGAVGHERQGIPVRYPHHRRFVSI
jgi:hypothetical protein